MKIKRFFAALLVFCMLLGTIGLFEITEEFQAVESTPDIVVVLDPGHDSRHGGASYYGYKEHELVYKIATYCKQELEQYRGVKVYMTRNSNECPCEEKVSSVKCNVSRVDYAQSVEADLYISFHLDAAENKSAKGATIFYPNSNYRPELGTQGKKLAISILQELNNIGISKKGTGIKIRNSEDNTLYPDGSLSDYLAVIRGGKLRGFTSVLIEHLYLSNRDEVNTFLNTEEKIKAIGVADATGIANYLGIRKDVSVKQGDDGNWYYYVGNVVDTSYTGFAKNENGWWYIKEGKVDFSANGLIPYRDEWWYVRDGKINFDYNEIATNENGTWYVGNGKVDFGINGIVQCGSGWYLFENGAVQTNITTVAQNENGWWYVKNGQVDFNATTVAQNENGWWYIKDGKVDFAYDGVGTNENGTWYINDGKVNFGINGLVQSGKGWYLFKNGAVQTNTTTVMQKGREWWYINRGQADFTATTVAQNENGWWYIKNGKVDFAYDGIGTNENGTWYINDGSVNFGINGVIYHGDGWYYFQGGQVQRVDTVAWNENGWWYINNGKVDFGYNGLGTNENGTWYINGGSVNFGINGIVQCGDGWYLFRDGAVQTNTTTVAQNENSWWYVKNGQVDFSANTVAENENGWWYIKDGKVDFTYDGLGKDENGTWYIEDGKVNFDINGIAYCGDEQYYFKGGQVQYVTTVVEDADGLWYVNNGKLDVTYNGVVTCNDVIYTVINGQAYEEGTAIMGDSDITVEQMVAYYNANESYPEFYQNSDAPDIAAFCQIYLEECAAEGVNPEVAFCQAMLETGFLRFGGQVDISQYNFAGIGAVDGGASGASFPDVCTGIRAQVQHLKAYACDDALNQECVDPRFELVKRGTAPYVEWLGIQENPYTEWGTKADETYGIVKGCGWASAKEYGFMIRSKYIAKLNAE